jgi:hypothetical protein
MFKPTHAKPNPHLFKRKEIKSKSLLQRRKRHLVMDILLHKAPSNCSTLPGIKHQSHSMPLATRKIVVIEMISPILLLSFSATPKLREYTWPFFVWTSTC